MRLYGTAVAIRNTALNDLIETGINAKIGALHLQDNAENKDDKIVRLVNFSRSLARPPAVRPPARQPNRFFVRLSRCMQAHAHNSVLPCPPIHASIHVYMNKHIPTAICLYTHEAPRSLFARSSVATLAPESPDYFCALLSNPKKRSQLPACVVCPSDR